MGDRIEELKTQANNLPLEPGVYLFYDSEQRVIYVGKAKKLRNRVNSYFLKNIDSPKTRILVRKIAHIEHLIVNTEEDALLLENTLIKKYQPRYNIQLKDDKTYPWICVKKEDFPRIFMTRKLSKDGSEYYGPYPSANLAKTLIDLIRKLYPIRTCKLNLSHNAIAKGMYTPCLEYHMKNCMAPCIGKESKTSYEEYITQVKTILRGNIRQVKEFVLQKINKLAEELKFEEAHSYKEKLIQIENYQVKSTVVNAGITNIDIFSLLDDDRSAYVNFIKVIDGAVIQTHTLQLKRKMQETPQELLQAAIVEIRTRYPSTAKEIIVPFDPEITLQQVTFHIPQRGAKKKLLELSERNARFFRLEQLKHSSKLNKEQRTTRILNTIKKDLHLKELPKHIECFDNSNLQGTNPVAACVVFKDAKPAKKEYRHFNIKTVEGPNDFASMTEVVYRRYKRLTEEKQALPQLIVIDGGKGQLSAARAALKQLKLEQKIPIIGIAKRLEEIYFPNDSYPLHLDKNSETLKIIQQLRDEAHRFGITFHRKKREAAFIQPTLAKIPGIGPKTQSLLLKKYRKLNTIKDLSLQELTATLGKSKGNAVYHYFHSTDKQTSKQE